jgi:hypothetical protein
MMTTDDDDDVIDNADSGGAAVHYTEVTMLHVAAHPVASCLPARPAAAVGSRCRYLTQPAKSRRSRGGCATSAPTRWPSATRADTASWSVSHTKSFFFLQSFNERFPVLHSEGGCFVAGVDCGGCVCVWCLVSQVCVAGCLACVWGLLPTRLAQCCVSERKVMTKQRKRKRAILPGW